MATRQVRRKTLLQYYRSIERLTIFPQILFKHYQRILNCWPVDSLRPEVSFQKVLQRKADETLNPSSVKPSQDNIVANEAKATIPTAKSFDEKGELDQVNVLYSFLENRYAKKVGRKPLLMSLLWTRRCSYVQ